MALFMRLASKPEPSQCPEQRHWLHCTCQPIVSRISCDLALAGCRMAVTAAAQSTVSALTCPLWINGRGKGTDGTSAGRECAAIGAVPAHRESNLAATLLWLGAVWQSQRRSGNRRSCTCVGGSHSGGNRSCASPKRRASPPWHCSSGLHPNQSHRNAQSSATGSTARASPS